ITTKPPATGCVLRLPDWARGGLPAIPANDDRVRNIRRKHMTTASRPASTLRIRKAAVLGAGVMGAQIAAQLTNAGVETVLFDLPAKEGPKSGIALKAIANLQKLSPAPLAEAGLGGAIVPANYDDDLEQLRGVDFVIEAIAERMDWKLDLF